MKSIEIKNVSKQYKTTLALDHVSFDLDEGKIYGLLGRNGAGKSTLLNILANRIFASEGEIFIDGETCVENTKMQEKLYCMSEVNYYPNDKIKDIYKWTNLFYSCFDYEKALKLAEDFDLNLNKKVNELSTGYKSIFKLIIALSLNVPYVIYDEPVLGLDANHREKFYKHLLNDFTDNQKTIIIATHLIEEIAHLIEEVIIIDKGHVLLQDSLENLMAKGYSVAGNAQDVDEYTKGERVIGTDLLGGMKIAYIIGDIKENKMHERLQRSSLSLQKLFVKLTEGEEVNHEA